MGWTDYRVELLSKLWQDGLSASQIAKQLGGVTRNAVISKIHRLGLSNRAKASQPARRVALTRGPQAITAARSRSLGVALAPEARLPRVVIPFREETPGSATILSITSRQCRWPLGDPQDPGFTLCGCRAEEGPYCAPHRLRAFTSAATREWVDRKLGLEPGKRFAT